METAGSFPHDGERIAWRRQEGAGPTIVWIGGFRSDMNGTKAVNLARWAEITGRSFLRFDYTGHGLSSGEFKSGTISRWRSDALAVVDRLSAGPLILVGSSMGAWIALLVAQARPDRIRAMALIAPAPDFTSKLIEPGLSDEARAALERDGVWTERTADDPEGYPLTRLLIEDGRRWSVLPGPIDAPYPVRIIQGGQDKSVPLGHAMALAQALKGQDVKLELIPDGDHRLSRPADLKLIGTTIAAL
jgi:pimeloyl-ACP methyl ester carboxylesterase